ncbi:acyl-CoA thioesterase [Pyrobaculum aerophilum]|uniref:acyl-CoA thioesterase n=1 Tax=Pyrobaculum aerophilum TaxID=13773 RepID=UPI0023F15BAF|nr:thioesterase family protein [Pyrobaculum aerophilum]MCX8137311.1 acyl-CoA thioesterase [Pyrobaculum aerophilum]
MRFPVELRYADTDQMGLIYFVRHLIYADEAIGKFLKSLGIDLLSLEKSGIYTAVVHADIDFKRPLRYGEYSEVDVDMEKIGTSSISFKFSVYGNGELKSMGRIVYVFINNKGVRVEIPADIKERLEKYLYRISN